MQNVNNQNLQLLQVAQAQLQAQMQLPSIQQVSHIGQGVAQQHPQQSVGQVQFIQPKNLLMQNTQSFQQPVYF